MLASQQVGTGRTESSPKAVAITKVIFEAIPDSFAMFEVQESCWS